MLQKFHEILRRVVVWHKTRQSCNKIAVKLLSGPQNPQELWQVNVIIYQLALDNLMMYALYKQ